MFKLPTTIKEVQAITEAQWEAMSAEELNATMASPAYEAWVSAVDASIEATFERSRRIDAESDKADAETMAIANRQPGLLGKLLNGAFWVGTAMFLHHVHEQVKNEDAERIAKAIEKQRRG